ncbi:hypothetical protein E3Q24_00079 [Wallemia mellicola]|nr:hypothetical protein E3Q24_00079 [Wallemia mellicola]TIC26687.1 DNA repair protein [Wallemia mellicola]
MVDDQERERDSFLDFSTYIREKRIKLQNQNDSFDVHSQLFSGLVFHTVLFILLANGYAQINGYTNPSLQELRKIILQNGGKHIHQLINKSDVTHIISSNLTPRKRLELKNLKVCTPDWITQSVQQNKLLPWQNFILDKDKTPQTLLFDYNKPNERAQDLLKSDEWRQSNTANSMQFLPSFYSNSRLHFLSSSKANLKLLVQSAQENLDSRSFTTSNPAKSSKLSSEQPSNRFILHVDMDSFFVSASLSQAKHSHLRQKAVAISHGKSSINSTSELASVNYIARQSGLRNGMILSAAKKLCPELITLPYDFELYNKITVILYEIFLSHSDLLQAVSVDEALLDVSKIVANKSKDNTSNEDEMVFNLAEDIRNLVRERTSCEASVGIGSNILLAKLATRRAKPAGTFHLKSEQAVEFLSPLQFDSLPGVGSEMRHKIQHQLGVFNIGELIRNKSLSDVQRVLGKKLGETVWNNSHGIDDRQLVFEKKRQSVSAEVNYGIRFENMEETEKFFYNLSGELSKRLIEAKCKSNSLTVKIMTRRQDAPKEAAKFLGHGVVDVHSKSRPLSTRSGGATDEQERIFECSWKILQSVVKDYKDLRGIGFQAQKLEHKDDKEKKGQIEGFFKRPRQSTEPNSGASTSQSRLPEKAPQPAARPPVEVIDISSDMSVDLDESDDSISSTLSMPTQADRKVWRAIPQNIRKEVLEERQRIKNTLKTPFKVPFKTPNKAENKIPPGEKSPIVNIPNTQAIPATPSINMLPSQADPAVWKALPSDIRKEVLSENQMSKTPVRAPPPPSPISTPSVDMKPSQVDGGVWKELPSTIRKEILTERFADRTKKMTMSNKQQQQQQEVSSPSLVVPNSQIDQGVWRELPSNIRRNLTEELSKSHNHKPMKMTHTISAQTSVKAQQVSNRITKKSQLIARPSVIPMLMRKTDIKDVLNVVESWLDIFRTRGPHASDVQRIKVYVVKLLKQDTDGMSKTRRILKLWKRKNDDFLPVLDLDLSEKWQNAFANVKQTVDEIVQEKYGSNLSIK